MSMLDGVSQCWWLSKSCVVNWEAWAAVGTVLAVFTAVFAPAIQRLFVRKRANAMFALAYRTDLLFTLSRLRGIRRDHPIGAHNDQAWAAEALLETDKSYREDYASTMEELDRLTSREVDLNKWPAVDVRFAAKVALAIETTRHFQQAARQLVAAAEIKKGEALFKVVELIGRKADEHLHAADSSAVIALKPISSQRPLDK